MRSEPTLEELSERPLLLATLDEPSERRSRTFLMDMKTRSRYPQRMRWGRCREIRELSRQEFTDKTELDNFLGELTPSSRRMLICRSWPCPPALLDNAPIRVPRPFRRCLPASVKERTHCAVPPTRPANACRSGATSCSTPGPLAEPDDGEEGDEGASMRWATRIRRRRRRGRRRRGRRRRARAVPGRGVPAGAVEGAAGGVQEMCRRCGQI